MLPEDSVQHFFKDHDMDEKLSKLVSAINDKYELYPVNRVFTVAISGIDAAGKGYISRLLSDALKSKGYNVALINIDPWQNTIPVRLKKENAAGNIYENIFRWNDLFEQLIFPLQKDRAIYLETEGIRSDADIYYPLIYDLRNIDILLVEGIFLLKQKYLSCYDFKIWIDCSFETGLQRAIQRNAENLDEVNLLHDYNMFYYPAQRYHFEKDDPRTSADIIFDNN